MAIKMTIKCFTSNYILVGVDVGGGSSSHSQRREGSVDFISKLGPNSGVQLQLVASVPQGLKSMLQADAHGTSFLRL